MALSGFPVFSNPREPTLPVIHPQRVECGKPRRHVQKAYTAAEELEGTMREIDRNQRDYYPLAPDAWPKAREAVLADEVDVFIIAWVHWWGAGLADYMLDRLRRP